ncbi:alpha-mannosidase [Actinomyces bovis]|uniref:Alpha-mannosidase n=1 Tax=Actinomyces bovis TaxID=1658 RepID=A0ABY1VQ05_9ACTO|nr:glycoside hydrolase family 38 C-terminal domain-containing protein [Actinomyces bovis]SPT53721.1 alpha-mannosidase [Actinomyces bovis]VEG55873.1 alpha-mannosidase [Actinomyces israelii]
MHDNRPMLLKHIDRILVERLQPAAVSTILPLNLECWEVTQADGPVAGVPGAGEPVPFSQALQAQYRPCSLPLRWGPPWGTTWFRLRVVIPEALRHRHLELDLDLGWADHSAGFQCEGLVRTPHGEILKAVNPRNRWVPVTDELLDAEGQLELYLEAASNPLLLDVHPFLPTDEGSRATQSHAPSYTFATANLVQIHDEVRALAADVDVLLGLARTLPEDSPRGWKVLLSTSAALDQLDLADVPGSAAQVRALLAPLLAVPAAPDAITLGAVGHAHIDSAWLWPVRETRRKVVRTMANVLRLLEDGSPMIFALPAAQHLAWLQEDEPELFSRVKAQVAAGRIVPVGGSWVEPDAVLPSGESLVRQLTEGTAFFREELGVECHEIWLPDSFGYTGSLPQIAHLAGYDNFLTQKISWNQVDVFPHHTLWWEGIDGTRIFTHFPPADTYGAEVSAEQLRHAETNFKDKGRASTELFLYGYGDGGGGPTREMVERVERVSDLAGMPRTQHLSPQEFFARARAEYPEAPVWVGELYLEKHRGTLTTQAATKRANRRAEAALREAETWCTTAWARGLLADDAYPAALLHRLWRTTLLCQFHDILPGSSIAWAYEDAEAQLGEVIATCEGLTAAAQQALVTGEPAPCLQEVVGSTPVPDGVVSLSATSSGTSQAPALGAARVALNPAPVPCVLAGVEVPALGGALLPARDGESTTCQAYREEAGAVLDNGLVRAQIAASGAVVSLRLQGREVVPPGARLGILQLANDFPNEWDAWDLDPFYRSSLQDLEGSLQEVRADASGALAEVEVAFGQSRAQLTWSLAPGAEQLDLQVKVSWQESEKVLKLALPVDVHANDAAYGSQFGHLRRPTHENTSWDAYRFEVCAHKWLHVGEPGYGVGVANDATYGWDLTRHLRQGGGTWTLVRATLLRAPRYPDPQADRGEHEFRFALTGGESVATVRAAAYRLDLPSRQLSLPAGANTGARLEAALAPLVQVEGAVLESLHLADPQDGEEPAVLVRLYEPEGARRRVTLRAHELTDAVGADLHGRPSTTLGVQVEQAGSPGEWAFELHPFGVATIRLRRRTSQEN